MPQTTKRSHALIIGGGIAGLLAARIVLDHFEHVTLVERDHYPQEPGHRAGTPQDRQVHTMLLRGQRLLETLFPGLQAKLLEQGAVERVYGYESLYYYGGRCPRLPAVLRGWNCSRMLLEWQIRQAVTSFPHLRLLEGYEAIHLLFDKQQQVVCGVQIRARNSEQEVEELHADLVIDASGVSSRVPQWLEELGYQRPPETVLNPDLGYATRFYQPPTSIQLPWKGIAIQGTQQNRRGGTLMEIEGGRWMVVVAGVAGDYPPTDEEGYLAFARGLPDPALFEAIEHATPLSPIYGYRRTENRLRHVERVPLPEGLLLMGDALCCFNPIYGQGMTVAVQQALTLDACLRSKREGRLARRFHRRAARVLAFSWQLATSADERSLGQAPKGGVAQRYLEGVIALLPHDQRTLLTFIEVMHLLRSPLALLHPLILVKVITRMKR